jgi:hypothetical protein
MSNYPTKLSEGEEMTEHSNLRVLAIGLFLVILALMAAPILAELVQWP